MPVEVRLGGVRDVPGAGFLRVVPDGEQRRPAWFGTLDRSDERSKLRNPQTVLSNRFGIPYSRMPPARAAYPLKHAELEREIRDGHGVLVWTLHGRDPTYRCARRIA